MVPLAEENYSTSSALKHYKVVIGLMLAIPAMVFYGILKNRIQRLVLEIGMVSEGLMGRFAAVGKKA